MIASDRTAQILDRLADMDLTAAEHVHAQLLAATEPKAVAELSRAYQRCSRAVRQVLMLKMKHENDLARAARGEAADPADTALDRFIEQRADDLREAVGRVAAAAHPDRPRLRREALDRLDVEIERWIDTCDDDPGDSELLTGTLDAHVAEACRILGLPLPLARRWEDLPPWADTG